MQNKIFVFGFCILENSLSYFRGSQLTEEPSGAFDIWVRRIPSVGKLGRARRPTRTGRDGLARLCAQPTPRLFRQRRPLMGAERWQIGRTTPRLGSNRRSPPKINNDELMA